MREPRDTDPTPTALPSLDEPRVLGGGDWLYRQGEPASRLWVVERGSIELVVETENGDEVVLGVVGRGDFFGEAGLFTGGRRTSSARAVEPSRVVPLDRGSLEQVAGTEEGLLWRMLETMASRMGFLEDRVSSLHHAAAIASAPLPPRERDLEQVPLVATSERITEHGSRAVAAQPAATRRVELVPAQAPPQSTSAAIADDVPALPPTRPVTRPRGIDHQPRLETEDGGHGFLLPPLLEVLVGRAGQNDADLPDIDLTALNDRTVSRRHARIRRDDGGWWLVEEPDVPNGTRVNGTRVAPGVRIPLTDGATVQFGGVRLVFRT